MQQKPPDKPYTTHHEIPIYLLKLPKHAHLWLQWRRGKVRYGIAVKGGLNDALGNARKVIDAMLELEAGKT